MKDTKIYTCNRCEEPTKYNGLCTDCMLAEFDGDEVQCWQCHGTNYVSDCLEEWACIDPEEGCDLCTRVCDVCHSPKQAREKAQQAMDKDDRA